MTKNILLWSACAALVTLASSTLRAQEPEAPQLRRVDPAPAEPRSDPLARVFSRQFDREEWKALLATPDLDQREKNLDDLLRRARIDPLTRVFLEELVRDADHPELAWTARLALRELGPARFPLRGGLPGDPFQLHERFEDMFRELWADQGGMGFFVRPPRNPSAPLSTPGSSSRSVQVQQDPGGARVVITENVDGQEKTRTYEGASLDEILQENPDLARELESSGVSLGESKGDLDLRFRLGSPWRGWGPFGERDGAYPGDPGAERRPVAPQEKSQPLRSDVLGVVAKPLAPERARELGLEVGQALQVRTAYEGTYAHLLGVRAGDVLLELNGVVLRTEEDISRVMRSRAADDELTLVWIDGLGQRHTKSWSPPGKSR